ncbi:MAG: pyrroline-5-carboxylate reductase [Pirellulales bacterium]|nr:pyrroline-5-carboxylate reductase [Pirellulales bacterium]
MTKMIGFIGAGRMATALARGCAQAGLLVGTDMLAADPHEGPRRTFAEQVPGVRVVDDNRQVLAAADLVILAVKPQVMSAVLGEIADKVDGHHLLVSIAAGVTLKKLAHDLPPQTRLIRVMPNTPCLVGMGASCYSLGPHAMAEDARRVHQMLLSVGQAFEVKEESLDAVTGLSGSGPAFVYSMIEALAAEGTAQGLPPELADKLAVQTMRGAAEMVLTTGTPPAELRGQVTSPGGTTLAGLEAWKKQQGAAALRAAVAAATKRSVELGQS